MSGSVSTFSQSSTVQTTVNGPGTLSFWWRAPSTYHRLSFIVDSTTQTYITAYSSWKRETFYLQSGSQTLKWTYSFDMSPGSIDRGYLDEVSYVPGQVGPIITIQPSSQSQVHGLNATFTVETGGTPPLRYQWQFNGDDIPGATSASFTVTNVQTANLGDYRVVVSNVVGSIVSSNAQLEFGQLTAWGSPGYSGYSDTAAPLGATSILAIAAGGYFNLALRANGTLLGWGNNLLGQTRIPTDLTNIVAIAAGTSHGLLLKADGTVAVWGDYYYGQTNLPAGLANVVAIAAGAFHSLALKSDGSVVAWGYSNATNVPAGLTNVVAIAAGGIHSLALKADGTVTTWSSGPAVPTNLASVVAIAAGAGHDLALLSDGTVVGWGQNNYGQASVPAGLTSVVAISAGDFHSLALLANGTVVGWGQNTLGQTNVPTGLTNVIAISAGDYHNLALVGDGPPILHAAISNPTLSENGFGVSVPTQSGRVYALEFKNSLADANWTALPLVAGNGDDLVLTDSSATNSQRYYRVRQW